MNDLTTLLMNYNGLNVLIFDLDAKQLLPNLHHLCFIYDISDFISLEQVCRDACKRHAGATAAFHTWNTYCAGVQSAYLCWNCTYLPYLHSVERRLVRCWYFLAAFFEMTFWKCFFSTYYIVVIVKTTSSLFVLFNNPRLLQFYQLQNLQILGVWPDLAKFRQCGNILKVFGNCLQVF